MAKSQRGHPKAIQLINVEHDWFSQLGHSAVISTGLPTPATLGFRFSQ